MSAQELHKVVPAINEVNAYIIALQRPDVIVLDAATLLADEQGHMRDDYSRDFLHLNAAGYIALNQALVHILETIAPISRS